MYIFIYVECRFTSIETFKIGKKLNIKIDERILSFRIMARFGIRL